MIGVKMSYIYAIKDKSEKYLYVGQTKRDPKIRMREHFKDIEKGIHKIKKLNTYKIEQLEFEVLIEVDTDNSLVLSTLENFYNSLLCPLNKCIATGFRGSSVTFAREGNKDLCEDIIEVIGRYY